MFSRLWKPRRRPYFADASYMWYLRLVIQKEARNSNLGFKNLNFELKRLVLAPKPVLHCILAVFSSVEASSAAILRRCLIYVIFEVSNEKRSLKFTFWIQKFEFWAVTASFGAKTCFSLFFTVFLSVEASSAPILRRRVTDVILEVSNEKRSLEISNFQFKIWIASFFLDY